MADRVRIPFMVDLQMIHSSIGNERNPSKLWNKLCWCFIPGPWFLAVSSCLDMLLMPMATLISWSPRLEPSHCLVNSTLVSELTHMFSRLRTFLIFSSPLHSYVGLKWPTWPYMIWLKASNPCSFIVLPFA